MIVNMQKRIAIKLEADAAVTTASGSLINVKAYDPLSLTGEIDVPGGVTVWVMNDATARNGSPIDIFRSDEVIVTA